MALVSRAVEVPVPCPSPARVGSTGTIQYLLQKERPTMDHQATASRGSAGVTSAKSSREFVQVCREVVSVTCGQPLLSYKPKRSKSASKGAKPSESKAVCSRSTVESSGRSVSSRTATSAIRLVGASEVVLGVELRRGDSLPRVVFSTRARGSDLPSAKKGLPHGESLEVDGDKKFPPASRESDENGQMGEYPVFQMSNSLLGTKPLPDDYHKALIPFLRAEWDASAKILKRREASQVPKKSVHRRSTSLGSSSSTSGLATDQKAWQSYTRDSYPPFSASKKYSFFRLTSGEKFNRD